VKTQLIDDKPNEQTDYNEQYCELTNSFIFIAVLQDRKIYSARSLMNLKRCIKS